MSSAVPADLFAWFCAGTRLLTPHGEVPVDSLAVGDLLVTIRADGPPCARVARVERRTIDLSRDPALARPVRVSAAAFASAMPARDLWLAPHHGIYADGALLAVNALCDGELVCEARELEAVTYVRVELECHDVVLAENLPVASSLGLPGNVVALHPRFGAVAPAQLCLALHQAGPAIAQMRRVLAHRAQPARRTGRVR